ncbi:MAG: hypothetical protein JWR38_812 [Mucilaginibacter sp.]|nr:hypothetical protein [Mucilaginibacter sp.]
MKTQRYLFLLSIICLSFLLVKCGKDGAVGPAGNTGDKGAAGATGAVGPAGPAGANGSAGSVIYSGNTTPAASKGVIGDFYLDTSTGLLYGPKTANGWGTGFSLKGANGATGATGAAGSTTLSGAGVPAASLGKTGDYYLDKTNYLLYGPKTASGWGVPINLQGPAGPQGPAGNANVKVDVFTVKTADWVYNSTYWFGTEVNAAEGYVSKYFDRANSLITTDLLNSGLILVYYQSSPITNTVQWQPLPFSFTENFNSNYTFNYAYETSVGNVRLHFFFAKTGTVAAPSISTFNIPTHQFKIVVVSGTLISSIHQNHINVNNYNEVSRFLGIQ